MARVNKGELQNPSKWFSQCSSQIKDDYNGNRLKE
jgi:hypothetical protein